MNIRPDNRSRRGRLDEVSDAERAFEENTLLLWLFRIPLFFAWAALLMLGWNQGVTEATGAQSVSYLEACAIYLVVRLAKGRGASIIELVRIRRTLARMEGGNE